MPRDDLYKSGQIHTGPGEPANSVSKPTPRPKQVAARPVTTGKLLRPGGPGGGPSKLAARPKPAPAPQPLPQSRPQPAAAPTPKPVPQPVAAVAAATATGHGRTGSTGSTKAPPPPPPPASAPAPKKPTAKALYDFNSDQSNELSVRAGDVVQIVSREGNGKLQFTSISPQSFFFLLIKIACRLVALYEYGKLRSRLGSRSLSGGAGGRSSTQTSPTAATAGCSIDPFAST